MYKGIISQGNYIPVNTNVVVVNGSDIPGQYIDVNVVGVV